MRDLLGREAAHLAQRQRHLGVRWQRRMAAGEDQPQPVVLHTVVVYVGGGRDAVAQAIGQRRERGIEPGAPAQLVDGLEAPGGDEPRPRLGGHAFGGPALHCGRERVVQRLLGQIEVAEQADQGGKNAARLGAVDGVHHLAHPLPCVLGHEAPSRSYGR